ncbi:kinase-like domain-containing protein [Phyllosticta capitalensis]|uniref:Altered inheritance of mitochondria protein 9, mitochondrial n=1 Tax=Phyllosticta capitalensis TaxID=121624 RepID=A0ABR1YXG4_9PEZI
MRLHTVVQPSLRLPRSQQRPRASHIFVKQLNGHIRGIATNIAPDFDHLFRYDAGRWLWDEETRLRERYKRFNVPELQNAAAEKVGAKKCVSISKLAEGGPNRVFRLVMDNGASVIARIPRPVSQVQSRMMASEVATMDLARTILDIPVPKVLGWQGDAENPVQSEYMLMEEAFGVPLFTIWDDMSIYQKEAIVDEVIGIEKKLLSLSFSRYGNLYHAEDACPKCESFKVAGSLPQQLKEDVERRFVIGPVVDEDFWKDERARMDIDRGPWTRPEDYLKAIAHREIAWLSQHAGLAPRRAEKQLLPRKFEDDPRVHIGLYRKFEAVVDGMLPRNRDILRSTLWHFDLGAANLFVQDGKISSVIDWQGAWAGPLLFQARHPRLVSYAGELTLSVPEEYEPMEDEDEKAAVRTKIERSIIVVEYQEKTARENPTLDEAFKTPCGKVLQQTVAHASNTWDEDLIALRQCLIRVVRYWDEINGEIPCAIEMTAEEMQANADGAEDWNAVADLWDTLSGIVQRDGWVSHENYEGACEVFALFKKIGLEHFEGEQREDFERITRWVAEKDLP